MQVIAASMPSLTEQRQKFVLTEKAITRGNDKAYLYHMGALKNYPLYPYLKYQWRLKNLHKSKKIQAFLKDHAKTRYAWLLKYRWQLYLAKNKHWKDYIKQYSKTNNTKLQCHFYRAKYNTGSKKEALLGAKKLWAVGKSQPDECDPIFEVLKDSRYFTRDLLWQRFSSALSRGNAGLAKYVKRSMSKKDQTIAQLWLKIHSNPLRINDKKLLRKNSFKADKIFTHGIKRLTWSNIDKAVTIWDTRKNDFKINAKVKQKNEQKLAISMAVGGNKKSYQRLNQLKNLSDTGKEWQVRAALKEQHWPHVEAAIYRLDKSNQKEDLWSYWLARALEKQEKQKEADAIYDNLSSHRSYYGYLSANKQGKEYELFDNPIQINKDALNKIQKKTDFRVVAEFIKVDKTDEARKQWWYSVGKLNKQDMLVAAKYAQQIQWDQIAILTVAKAKHWDDVSLRFPLVYKEQVKKNSELQQLNAAVIFGLIRRESAFYQKATSPVGARGLMQIMPRTGRQIAKELKDKRFKKADLFDPAKNIKYGSFYYKQLLDQFNGHYALAAAAYNAGPHRVNRWIPTSKSLPADIWVETIPYKETRGYVAAVLTYALIYQKQMNESVLSMNDFMREVEPSYLVAKAQK